MMKAILGDSIGKQGKNVSQNMLGELVEFDDVKRGAESGSVEEMNSEYVNAVTYECCLKGPSLTKCSSSSLTMALKGLSQMVCEPDIVVNYVAFHHTKLKGKEEAFLWL